MLFRSGIVAHVDDAACFKIAANDVEYVATGIVVNPTPYAVENYDIKLWQLICFALGTHFCKAVIEYLTFQSGMTDDVRGVEGMVWVYVRTVFVTIAIEIFAMVLG